MYYRRTLPARLICVILGAFFLLLSPAHAQECFPAPDGLVSWWPGDGDANDIEGNNNGALQGGAAFATGQAADGFDFDGVDDYVSVPENDDDLDAGLGELTVTAWIYPFGGGAASQRIVNKGVTTLETANRPGYRLGLVGGELRFGVSDNSSGALIDAQPSGLFPSDGQFHHVAGVLDRSTLEVRLYLDGGLIATRNFTSLGSLSTAVPLAIGALDRGGFGPNVSFFDGLIDEVAVFDRALTAAEITAVVDAGTAGKCKDEDGDGFRPPDDCDETDPTVNPNGLELPGNFVDENCDGSLGDVDPCAEWQNHGKYVRAVAHAVNDLVDAGIITEEEGDALVSSAAMSKIGKAGFVPVECQ